jgi:hypothetical protein
MLYLPLWGKWIDDTLEKARDVCIVGHKEGFGEWGAVWKKQESFVHQIYILRKVIC